MQKTKKKSTVLQLRVSADLLERIEDEVARSVYSTKSEWIRTVLEERLTRWYIDLEPTSAAESDS